MSPEQFLDAIFRHRAIAIFRGHHQGRAAAAMDAAVNAGFRMIEFTVSTPGVLELIAEFARRPGIVVGAGTVLDIPALEAVVGAGAKFLASPVLDRQILSAARDLDVAVLPGCFSPTELLDAHRSGAACQKLFPAPGYLPSYIRAVLAPMPFLRIVPTNGVTLEERRRRARRRRRRGRLHNVAVRHRRGRKPPDRPHLRPRQGPARRDQTLHERDPPEDDDLLTAAVRGPDTRHAVWHARARAMTISRLELTNFTVFEKASFEFCPGINVLIGENGTGKSHVLKAMYAFCRAAQEAGEREPGMLVYPKLDTVFRTRFRVSSSLRRRGCTKDAVIRIADASGAKAELALHEKGGKNSQIMNSRPAIFVPPREVLAMYRGFVAAYEGRELDFDETYYDLCKALGAAPLRGTRAKAIEAVLAPLEQILGGKVVLEGDRFVLKQDDGETEAHLIAEGLRKIASIAYLVANGSLTANSVLFWDEPEAGLNPTLVVKVVEFLQTLAAWGVQVFLASHDYLLVHRLSQTVEYGVEPAVPMRFFSLYRPEPGAAVEVEQGSDLFSLGHNAILDEFARYYDDEQELSARAMRGEETSDAPVRKKTAKAKSASSAKPKAAKKSPKSERVSGPKTTKKAPAKRGTKKAIRA